MDTLQHDPTGYVICRLCNLPAKDISMATSLEYAYHVRCRPWNQKPVVSDMEVKPKVVLTTERSFHYHEGHRGRCSCDNPLVKSEVKLERKTEPKSASDGPKNFHYHKGRRGRCSCVAPEGGAL